MGQIRGLLDSGLTTEMNRVILPYLCGPGRLVPAPEDVPAKTAALLRGHIDRVQARTDCLARDRDRLAASLAAVRPDGG
ncbi:hypothetical protein [Streptomyces sp. NPDC052721]|uniref:hypothetical protein n=1 Tax=Streptomyces sp. NPDC052721 TaxID=3154955 RepID=UPI00342A490C